MTKSRIILTIIIISFFISGLFEAIFSSNTDYISISHGILFIFLVFLWLIEHSKENELIPPKGSKILTILLPPAGLIYYFYKRYNFKMGSVYTIGMLFIFSLSIAFYVLAYYLIHLVVT